MATQQRREQDRARRSQEILLAARAVFAQNGFHRATVDQVAQQAEVAKGTIYLYFENKEAILVELTLCALSELVNRLTAAGDEHSLLNPEAKLRAMAQAYRSLAEDAPDYFRLLTAFDNGDFDSGLSPERRTQLRVASNCALELVAQAISDGMALGVFAPGDARRAAGILWAALNGALTLMAHPVRRHLIATDIAEFYNATLEVCLKGLACPSQIERSET